MEYTKPVVLAQNTKEQSFAAGCPLDGRMSQNPSECKRCERSG